MRLTLEGGLTLYNRLLREDYESLRSAPSFAPFCLRFCLAPQSQPEVHGRKTKGAFHNLHSTEGSRTAGSNRAPVARLPNARSVAALPGSFGRSKMGGMGDTHGGTRTMQRTLPRGWKKRFILSDT